jgi:hypothetical protein
MSTPMVEQANYKSCNDLCQNHCTISDSPIAWCQVRRSALDSTSAFARASGPVGGEAIDRTLLGRPSRGAPLSASRRPYYVVSNFSVLRHKTAPKRGDRICSAVGKRMLFFFFVAATHAYMHWNSWRLHSNISLCSTHVHIHINNLRCPHTRTYTAIVDAAHTSA